MTASLRQVAERAGVSIRTVSNVVSGFGSAASPIAPVESSTHWPTSWTPRSHGGESRETTQREDEDRSHFRWLHGLGRNDRDDVWQQWVVARQQCAEGDPDDERRQGEHEDRVECAGHASCDQRGEKGRGEQRFIWRRPTG